MPTISNENMLPQGTILDGHYEIERYLSSGGFGNTYVARDLKFKNSKVRVAIKEFFIAGHTHRTHGSTNVIVSNPDNVTEFNRLREKFRDEAERLYALRNPHIVRVTDKFDANETSYYVMDYIDGLSLSKTIREQRGGQPFPESDAIRYVTDVLEALREVHKEGIWHLDIKPGNIMLNPKGEAILIDFGASKMMKNGGTTLSSTILYTQGYAPNEQVNSSLKKIGAWTDIYAVGATLYYLLTAWQPATPNDIIDDGIERSLPMPNVSEPTRRSIYKMMQPSIYERPQNVDEALALLQDIPYTASQPISPPQPAKDVKTIISHSHKTNDNDGTVISSNSGEKQEPFTPPFVKEKPKRYSTWWIVGGVAMLVGFIAFGVSTALRHNTTYDLRSDSTMDDTTVVEDTARTVHTEDPSEEAPAPVSQDEASPDPTPSASSSTHSNTPRNANTSSSRRSRRNSSAASSSASNRQQNGAQNRNQSVNNRIQNNSSSNSSSGSGSTRSNSGKAGSFSF